MVKTVIIGSGGIAHTRHIPNILKSDLGVLHGVYNRNTAHTYKDAATFGCKGYETLEEIWADGEVDAVIVCTPAATHCEYTVAALKAGKHVLCEKPMGLDAEEARAMMAAEKESGKKLMISHNQRYYQPHKKVKELLASGIIGRVLNFRSCLGLDLPMPMEGSPDYNAGAEVLSHRIDLMHHLFGAKVSGVFARLTRHGSWTEQGDDTAMAIFEYENGINGIFVVSRVSFNGNDRSSRFFGTEGSITLYGQKAPVVVERKNGEVIECHLPFVPSQREVEQTEVDDEFFRCVLEDGPVPVTSEDGLEVMQVVEAVYRANKEQRWVQPAR